MRMHYAAATVITLLVTLSCLDAANASKYRAELLELVGYDTATASSASGGSLAGWGIGPTTDGEQHALLWIGSADNVVDLHPNGFESSVAQSISGAYQVGFGREPSMEVIKPARALLWNGTAESVVDLHPAEFEVSIATGVSGDYQVGFGGPLNNFRNQALLWNGTAESVVKLNPAGYIESQASAISGTTQVGFGVPDSPTGTPHAMLWHGTASSYVDLHPDGFFSSFAYGASGEIQVGDGVKLGGDLSNPGIHALLWRGTAESVVDLHPAGNDWSTAFDAAGDVQVGVVIPESFSPGSFAYAWYGTAQNAVNLHMYLEGVEPELVGSTAFTIDDDGMIYGVAGDGAMSYIVRWTPVPE
ncbi:hypothetical protein NG895_23640, partial [Aeoliella sp. ICT_H6.2]